MKLKSTPKRLRECQVCGKSFVTRVKKICKDCTRSRRKPRQKKRVICNGCGKYRESKAFNFCVFCYDKIVRLDGRQKAETRGRKKKQEALQTSQVTTNEKRILVDVGTIDDDEDMLDPPKDENPIKHSPGTHERLAAMIARAEKGLSLFSDDDEQIHAKNGTRLRPLPTNKKEPGGRTVRVHGLGE